jgi:hypothetical protein
MRAFWLAAMIVGASAAVASAQVTRTATFENYVEGQNFQPTLLDPLSGIFFHDATGGTHSFTIEYASTEFGGGNYLTNGIVSPGPTGSWTGDFGFSADLPAPANRVSFDITYNGNHLTGVVLTGYDGSGGVVAQEQGPVSAPSNFTFEITSPHYDITHFTVAVHGGVFTGYDNVSYTVLPEPTGLWLALPAAAMIARRRRRFVFRC